ncbi:MAG: hypothetical protein H6742_02755 [Alphaproteobacteria bacterium]|nr:hypothetical protein [Alphaproteobacteria bacterium]
MSEGPRLVRSITPSPADVRRRATLIGAALFVVVMLGLVLWGSAPTQDAGVRVVIAAPDGSLLAVDGRPRPVLGTDGNHLLTLEPGRHEVAVTLKSGTVLEHDLRLDDGQSSVRLEVRFSRRTGGWSIVDLDVEDAARAAEKAEREARGVKPRQDAPL